MYVINIQIIPAEFDTFFCLRNFTLAGNSSLKRDDCSLVAFTVCVQLEETDAGLAVSLSKTSWGNPPGGETERGIKSMLLLN